MDASAAGTPSPDAALLMNGKVITVVTIITLTNITAIHLLLIFLDIIASSRHNDAKKTLCAVMRRELQN
jgi:hypothetical protein